MFSRRVLLSLIFSLHSLFVFAQKKVEYKQPRILILLDGSSSMVNEWTKDKDRFKAAGDIILRLMDSIYSVNSEVEFSLRVYGHEHNVPENNCFDTKREVIFSKNNFTQMALRLESLHPMGVSPIAYSLKVAAENDFINERDYAYSLILITDGGESCGGDICNVVKELLEKKIEFRPYIVSLVDYAPLKDQYNCLGNYLTVSKPSELVPAVNTITEAYRKVLSVKIVKPKLLDAKTIPSPSALKIKVDEVKIPPKEEEPIVIKQPEVKPEPIKDTPKPQPIIEKPTPVVEQPKPKNIQVDVAPFKKENIASIKRYGFDRIHYSLFWSTVTPSKRQIPSLKLPDQEPEPVVVAPLPPAPKPKETPKPITKLQTIPLVKQEKKEASFTTKLEPAPGTFLEIYFTDGKGKYYTSTPTMQLLDVKTGQQIKKFYRTTDAQGNPDPQDVPAGNYTLVIGKTGNYIAKNVSILPGNHNKINIVVTKGSLSFGYENNLKRPVTEFVATVKRNFEPGPTITQKCTSELEYEPGNYHIEINTLPISRRTVDLDFGVNVRLDIDPPGFVKFLNTDAIGKLALYCPLGDQYAKFYVMDITGNPENQKVRLQPGIYQAHWKNNPKFPLEPDVVQSFIVKSNQTLEIELNNRNP